MGSHSVTCHPAVVRIPPLPPAEAGTRNSNPGEMQGWVDLCYVKADRLRIKPTTCKSQVQRSTTDPPHNTGNPELQSTLHELWGALLRRFFPTFSYISSSIFPSPIHSPLLSTRRIYVVTVRFIYGLCVCVWRWCIVVKHLNRSSWFCCEAYHRGQDS